MLIVLVVLIIIDLALALVIVALGSLPGRPKKKDDFLSKD